jgi:hypothetical protein
MEEIRYSTTFKLNDVSMNLDVMRRVIAEFGEEKAIKKSIVSRLMDSESAKGLSDKDIDALVSIENFNAVEKETYDICGTTTKEVSFRVEAYNYDDAVSEAETFMSNVYDTSEYDSCDDYDDCVNDVSLAS